ncbi:MAG: proline dehydrogenase family protein [Candidatus Sumerlaeia bacterium]|nr:proline dehydrogenase family protein [Candidatus Sumerlaeia bacterium]
MNTRKQEATLERLAARHGKRLFRAMARHESRGLTMDRAQDMAMNLMMKDEDLRYRMLRFVDVYPALRSQASIAEHLEEYLTAGELETGVPPTRLSDLARSIGRHRGITQPAIAMASRLGIKQMGNQFIAGNTPGEVARKVSKMEKRGFLFSLDLLGEFVVSESQADDYQRRYLEMIEDFEDELGPAPKQPAAGPRMNLSIKLSSQTSKFDPMDPEGTSRDVRRRLRPLFRAARKKGAFLNIDMEKREFRDLTLRIILDLLDEEEFRGFPHIGTVHQAYLRDAEEVLQGFLAELSKRNQPMTIRLVKGAYWDSEQIWARQKGWQVPVYTDKRETDACFERCAEILMKNHKVVRTAIASHNVRSIAWALALKKAYDVPDTALEFQMLFGMAGPIKETLRDMGHPVRIYTPCGELIPGMSYLVRRILENTSNESFLRQRFTKGASPMTLLANPKLPPRPEWAKPANMGKGAVK